MNFGEKVKELREAKGLSQVELGRLIGVSYRTVQSYEAGKSYPKQREVYDRLAKELNVDVNYLRTENEVFMEEVGSRYGRRVSCRQKTFWNRLPNCLLAAPCPTRTNLRLLRRCSASIWIPRRGRRSIRPRSICR